MNAVALSTYLEPFQPYFKMDGVNEICINRPCEIWVEQYGSFKCYEMPILTLSYLTQFARLVAEYNQRDISPETPTLSSTLPNGCRIQFVMEPACERGTFVCSIRKQSVKQIDLREYFSVETEETRNSASIDQVRSDLLRTYEVKDYTKFLALAVLQRKNIIISGGTSTGKTTVLNSLLQIIPDHERIVTIETDREVHSHHRNVVHLLAAEGGKSVANITMLDLLKDTLRLRPDRILLSELRAEEAFPYLRAINSGHPGSLTTLHADSPEGCFNQLGFMVIQGGSNLTHQEVVTFAKSIVDVVVQIKRTPEGKRYISEVYFKEDAPRPSLVQPIRESRQVNY
jgi:type IV secretion system protein VirB11